MKFTGERVVIDDMTNYVATLQEHIARYNLALHPANGLRVLDAACGSGYGADLLSKVASSVMGVDISQEAIDYAKDRYKGIGFIQCDLNKDFPSYEYDLCVSFETIEHLENPEVFLKNVADRCKSFIFSIPVNSPGQYHKHVWDKEQIIELTKKYFSNISWYHQDFINIEKGLGQARFLVGIA